MNVKETLFTLINLPPRISVLLESNHGLGKSCVVAQAAAEMSRLTKKTYQFVDFRLAQCEVGDLIGMMRHVPQGEIEHLVFKNGQKIQETHKIINATVHDLAEWFPIDPDSQGFLFLDELPRAPRDVQNAVLELALDYRFHFHELPIGWRVVSAANDNMDVYSGTQLDPALYDRFLKIRFKPTFDEWFEYAEKTENVHRAILTYLTKFTADLGLDIIPEAGKITPTPRSWCKLSTCIRHMEDNGHEILKNHNYLSKLSNGFIGDISINFVDYIKKNYKVYNAEDILNKWNKEMEDDFKSMLVTEIAFYSKEICDHVSKNGDKLLTKKQAENLYRFLTSIEKEAATSFFTEFIGKCEKVAKTWYKQEIEIDGNKGQLVMKYVFGNLHKPTALK